jgi:glycosyltransferase involved in cell wall biosynthesis
MHKILVLYTELADYILNSFSYYAEKYSDEVHIIHWPINNEAPFSLKEGKGITLYNKSNYDNKSLKKLTKNINPDALICAGWMDKKYLEVVKLYSNKIPTILTMDNHWEGNFKQNILRLISPFYLKKSFSHIWVPGKPQQEYAKKLHFKDNQILTGFYVANNTVFGKIEYQPKNTFVYIGRYIEHKGIKDLWTAFVDLKKEFPNNWKLKCIGTGNLWGERVKHEDIEHLGFLQPTDISKHTKGGVFVLPSHFEPWGVVVHEFAMAGFPMIISDKVGSGTAFLNKNGYIFKSGNISDLKKQMKNIILANEAEIELMSNQSRINSKIISNDNWSKQLNNILTKQDS